MICQETVRYANTKSEPFHLSVASVNCKVMSDSWDNCFFVDKFYLNANKKISPFWGEIFLVLILTHTTI